MPPALRIDGLTTRMYAMVTKVVTTEGPLHILETKEIKQLVQEYEKVKNILENPSKNKITLNPKVFLESIIK